jgi:hypothetical protein
MKIKDEKLAQQIRENPNTKQDFEALLKKACGQKPKSSPKQSKT